MNSRRIERVILGACIPPLLGGFIFFIWISIMSTTPSYSPEYTESPILHFFGGLFYVPIISFFLFGMQSFLYSLLMEFVVQKISSDALFIAFSILLGALVPIIFGFEAGVIGGVVGLMVGCFLRLHIKNRARQA